LQEYGIDGQLLLAIKSLYCQPEVCVRVNGTKSKPFMWVLASGKGAFCLLFIIYMNYEDQRNQINECATIGNYKINRLLFADDLVLHPSTESGLQHA